jgi:hypothetical protein
MATAQRNTPIAIELPCSMQAPQSVTHFTQGWRQFVPLKLDRPPYADLCGYGQDGWLQFSPERSVAE